MGDDWIAKYDEYYVRFVPTWVVIRHAPGDFFITSDEIQFPRAFYDSPFYTEYMRSLDMHRSVAWTVFLDQRWCVTLFLAQSDAHGPTTLEEQELGTMLFPHIRHAFRTLWSSSQTVDPARTGETKQATLAERMREKGSGVLVLDESGNLIMANEKGESMLAAGDWLKQTPGGISGPGPGDTDRLRNAIRRTVKAAETRLAAPPETLIVRPAKQGTVPLRVTAQPLTSDVPAVLAPVRRARAILTMEPLTLERST
jgi:hypothetical protein